MHRRGVRRAFGSTAVACPLGGQSRLGSAWGNQLAVDSVASLAAAVSTAGASFTPEQSAAATDDGAVRIWTDQRGIEVPGSTTSLISVASDVASFERRVEDGFTVDLDAQSLQPA